MKHERLRELNTELLELIDEAEARERQLRRACVAACAIFICGFVLVIELAPDA